MLAPQDVALPEAAAATAQWGRGQLTTCRALIDALAPARVLDPALAALASVMEEAAATAGGEEQEPLTAAAVVHERLSAVVEACLLAAQGLDAARKQRKEEGEDEDDTPSSSSLSLLEALVASATEARALKLPKLAAAVGGLNAALREEAATRRLALAFDDSGSSGSGSPRLLLRQAHALLCAVQAAAWRVVGEGVLGHKGAGKLGYVCLRVFRVLHARGYCADTGEEGEGDGEGAEGDGGAGGGDDV